ncbi:restriction endonuclease subunit S [Lentzea alba]|uniref:restriction endonuclease subunit S n=1 Tax=Lentzea alba TaxID=2714351 RepID=UPI0039BF7E46
MFECPSSWNETTVGEVLVERPKNGYSPKPSDSFSGVYMLGLGCLTDEGFNPVQLKYAPSGDPFVERAILADGDLLISRANTRVLVGMVGRYFDIGHPCIYPDLMMRLQVDSVVRPEFLELLLRSARCRRQIQALASGTSESMVKISSETVMGIKIAIPEIDEQDRIVDALTLVDESVRSMEFEVAKLRRIKAAMVDDLLTGSA